MVSFHTENAEILYWIYEDPSVFLQRWYPILRFPLRFLLRNRPNSAEIAALGLVAALLAGNSVFAFRCGVEQHQMNKLVSFAQHRGDACLELGLRWEADDQEQQYRPGTSAGSSATVGPISGFVMDVTENESGHAEGRCRAAHANYKELLKDY